MTELVKCVLESIEKYSMINKGDTLICGLSGGPDSVCMLHILHGLKDQLGFELSAVHINHKIRGAKADEDMNFSENFARQLGIPFFSKVADVPKLAKMWKVSEEEAGRKVRYDTFREIGGKRAPYKIAVAHNSNDVAETFLFNLKRGTGLEGLCSIKRVNGDIIRPLLDIYKDDILTYLQQNRLAYQIDDTNFHCDYTRNKIRNHLIPFINEALNTDIVHKILQTTVLLEDDLNWLKESGERAYKSCRKDYEDKKVIDCTLFNEYPIALKRQVIRFYLNDCIGSLDGYGSYHVNELIELAKKESPSSLELPKKFTATFRYGRLSVEQNHVKNIDLPIRQPLIIPGVVTVDFVGWKVESEVLPNDKNFDYRLLSGVQVQFFDIDKTGTDLTVRNRKKGDIFKPFGLKGTKKLKDYLIDKKVEKEKRDMIPLIEGREGILWVVGYGRSELARVTDQTKTVLKLTFYESKGDIFNVQ
ncbi:MAG TPA: tRNA lysidine(34) synthetase TilS [Clostridiales bacterium]|nr:tRNA lysidine(34) synthetase TilS [Clostridiales bacterium]